MTPSDAKTWQARLVRPALSVRPATFAFPERFATFMAMRCPFCDADKEKLKVVDSRSCEEGKAIRRRRECLQCGKRFTTYERIEENVRMMVVKKDGSRVPWDRNKILTGLERACYKRPVQVADLQKLVDAVEDEVFRQHDKEVPSSVIGQLVSDRLRFLDEVAYVRFASVYRRFKTLEELVEEAKAVIDAKVYDNPGQGRLFVDSRPVPRKQPVRGNGQ
jgi:transcriptional repressor NrdR